eukprot:m.209635 g.209635  ORF g.209635 m.209635 type:complete len:430 (+) comp24669_c0_seq1:335-1624(+)
MFETIRFLGTRIMMRPTHNISRKVWERVAGVWAQQRWNPDLPDFDEFVAGVEFGFSQVRLGLIEPVPDISHLKPLVSRDLYKCLVVDAKVRQHRCIESVKTVLWAASQAQSSEKESESDSEHEGSDSDEPTGPWGLDDSDEEVAAKVQKELEELEFPEPTNIETEVVITGMTLLASPTIKGDEPLAIRPYMDPDDDDEKEDDTHNNDNEEGDGEEVPEAIRIQNELEREALLAEKNYLDRSTWEASRGADLRMPSLAEADGEESRKPESASELAAVLFSSDYVEGYGWNRDTDGDPPDLFLEVQTTVFSSYDMGEMTRAGEPIDFNATSPSIIFVSESDSISNVVTSRMLPVLFVNGRLPPFLDDIAEYPYRVGRQQRSFKLTWTMPLWTDGSGRIGDVRLMRIAPGGLDTPQYVLNVNAINSAMEDGY